jgi:hypothetical protein
MPDQSISELMAKVKLCLPAYLEELGVTFNGEGKILCLNPDHDDHSPSMGFVKKSGDQRLGCYSCQAFYDIFAVTHILEDKPMMGRGFLEENLYYLADKYSIPYERRELTEEELLEFRIQQTYEDTAAVLKEWSKTHGEEAFVHTRARKLEDHICYDMGVGTMPWAEYIQAMHSRGMYSIEWLDTCGIDADYIGNDYITFVIRDHKGQACGLARRWVAWTKGALQAAKERGEEYSPKYLNTSDRSKVFKKSKIVYGLNMARRTRSTTIELVEGYMDVLMLMQHGVVSVGAICGTNMAEDQAQVLRETGFTDVNFVMDSDEGGQKCTERNLNNLRQVAGVRGTITRLNFENEIPVADRDPCTWIQIYGSEAYYDQPRRTAFEWKLRRLTHKGVEGIKLVRQMLPTIAIERSAAERDAMAMDLSKTSGIEFDSIQEDIEDRLDRRVDNLVKRMGHKIDRAGTRTEKLEIISDIYNSAQEEDDRTDNEELLSKTAVIHVESILDRFTATNAGLGGWDCGIKCINEDIDGIPKSKELMAFGGNANTGKSTLLYNICHGLLTHDNPNLCCAFWTLDDPVDTFIARMLAIHTGYPIGWCRKPNGRLYNIDGHGSVDIRYSEALEWITGAVRENRLIPKGINIGGTVKQCERWVKTVQDETGKEVVLFVDSFHNVTGEGDERTKYKRITEWCQETADQLDFTIVASMECRKQLTKLRPRIDDLGESSKMAYGFKLVGMVHNELHAERENANLYWEEDDYVTKEKVKRPYLEVHYDKNKITSFKGIHYFQFRDTTGQLKEASRAEVQAQIDNQKLKKMVSHTKQFGMASTFDEVVDNDYDHQRSSG